MLKKKTMLRFLCTYLCILIPVLIVSIWVAQGTVQKLKNQQMASIQSQLNRMTTELGEQYTVYLNNSIRLASMTELLPYKMTNTNDYASIRKGIEVLNNAHYFNGTTSDLFLYYGTDSIYSAQGTSTPQSYFRNLLNCTAASADAILSRLDSDSFFSSVLWKDETNGYLLLHYPMRFGLGNNNGVSMNFCLSLNTLGSTLNRLTDTNPSYIYLSFEDGTTVCYYGDTNRGLTVISESTNPDTDTQQSYTILTGEIPSMHISAKVLYSSDVLLADVQRGQWMNDVILICAVLLSFSAAWVMSKQRYQQINRLERAFENGDEDSPTQKKQDELDRIRSMIVQTVHQNREWENTAQFSRKTLKQQTATMLFQGTLQDKQTTAEILRFCGIELQEPYYCVGGIRMECEESGLEAVLQLLSADLCCKMEIDGQNTIVFLLGLHQQDLPRQLRIGMAERIGQVLELFEAKKIRIALSRTFSEWMQVNTAFLEMADLLQTLSADSGEKLHIECADNAEHLREKPEQVILTHSNEIRLLLQSVSAKKLSDSLRQFRQLDNHIAENVPNAEIKRYLRGCILQQLGACMEQNPAEQNRSLLVQLAHIDPAVEDKFRTAVEQIIRSLCADSNVDEFEKIVRYIDENYARYDLTQEEVAEHAGVSRTAMSRLFRAKTGVNYIDYLTELRMKKAKELLLNTDIPVSEVFLQVGYITRHNCSRKFKDYFGMNASDVRRQKQK